MGTGLAWLAGVTSWLHVGGTVADMLAGIGRSATCLEYGGLRTTEKPLLANDSQSGLWTSFNSHRGKAERGTVPWLLKHNM